MISLTDMLDLAEKHARTVLIERQDDLMPLFDLRDGDGHSYIFGGPFVGQDADEVAAFKDMIAETIRQQIIEHKIVAYLFMSEAWMVVRRNIPGKKLPLPSKCDDRVEIVMAMATDGVDYQHRRWLIKREGEKCVDLKLDSEGETVTPSGRFDKLLNPTRH